MPSSVSELRRFSSEVSPALLITSSSYSPQMDIFSVKKRLLWRPHSGSNYCPCKAGEGATNPGAQVGCPKIFSSQLCVGNMSEKKQFTVTSDDINANIVDVFLSVQCPVHTSDENRLFKVISIFAPRFQID